MPNDAKRVWLYMILIEPTSTGTSEIAYSENNKVSYLGSILYWQKSHQNVRNVQSNL